MKVWQLIDELVRLQRHGCANNEVFFWGGFAQQYLGAVHFMEVREESVEECAYKECVHTHIEQRVYLTDRAPVPPPNERRHNA